VCAEFGVFGGVFFACPAGRGLRDAFFVDLEFGRGLAGFVVWFGVALLVFWPFLALVVVCLGWSFGLSLLCSWSISVAPVRGGTYFSLPAAKKSRQKKAAHTASS